MGRMPEGQEGVKGGATIRNKMYLSYFSLHRRNRDLLKIQLTVG